MSGSENNKEITSKPLPKELQALVDKEEEDKKPVQTMKIHGLQRELVGCFQQSSI